ncbi:MULTISPECIES: Rne/Rng family ribonuclease [unclassified Moraxella]|uniref:Rne/Rng family ribonuclease n=1 Tax=unclassified Moraxella TaxID=2685852 RepID=UPI003AF6939B
MTEELLININPTESRVAVLEDGVLNEIFIERHNKLGSVGNIYIGTVVRVLPGMQAAFVDIGQSRTAFLHVNDMQSTRPKPSPVVATTATKNVSVNTAVNDTLTSLDPDTTALATAVAEPMTASLSVTQPASEPSTPTQNPPTTTMPAPMPASHELIENRLYEGQRILVQVIKDQLGTKGSRLTTDISLPSRYLVYLPYSSNIGISQRIDGEERERLKTDLTELSHQVNLQGGLIARTAAENIPRHKLEEDIYYLLQLWRMVQARKSQSANGRRFELIYQDLSLPLRAIRDLIGEKTERVTIDNAMIFNDIRQFAKEFVPLIFPRIHLYENEQPLFDVYRVEDDLKDALNRRVNLKSGGYLIIDQTEAMTTIDVNTGSFVGGRSLEDTVYKTNLEATHAIARQLRLRNLGGIIILDFIDMQEQQHRDKVMASLQEQLSRDYAKTNISEVSNLGLVEMTRKRTRESLQQQLCEPCPTCGGKGFVKSRETVCLEIFRELMRCARAYNAPKKFTVIANQIIIEVLMMGEADTVAEMEYLLGRPIELVADNRYNQEQYDILLD